MKVPAQKQFNVEINEDTVKKIIVKSLRKLFDVKKGAYIKDDKLLIDEEQVTSHSWYTTEVIRDATENDKMFMQFMKEFEKLWKKSKVEDIMRISIKEYE
jgi:hypothetical protein